MYGLEEPTKPDLEYIPPNEKFTHVENIGLIMECCEEILSGAQREAFCKAKKAYEDAIQRILYLKSLNAKIINNDHTDVSDDVEYIIDSKIGKNNSIEIHPVIKAKISQPDKRNLITKSNSDSVSETIPAPTNTSYKVLYDSRTGTVVGKLPGDTTILSQGGSQTYPGIESRTVTTDKNKQFSTLRTLVQGDKSNTSENSGSQRTVTIVSGGHKMVTTYTLLAVRVRKEESVSLERRFHLVKELKNLLEKEGYRDHTIQWMRKIKMFPDLTQCRWCHSSLAMLPDKSALDGCIFKCNSAKCGKTCPVVRLPFFGRFGIPMNKLLALTYHWVVQSDTAEVIKDVGVDVYTIRSMWRALQEVCGISVSLKSQKLGGTNCSVEFGIAQLGRFLVNGVYDRRTKLTRLKAMSVAVGLNIAVFLKTIEPWLHKKSLVISSDPKLSKISTIGLQHVLVKPNSSEAAIHTDNISSYLRKQLSILFGEFAVNQLKMDTVQGFLDELQWRERYDTSPSDCFWNIIKHITDQTSKKGTSVEISPIVSPVSSIVEINIDSNNGKRSQNNDDDVTSNKKLKVSEVNVNLDEYYYARMEPQIPINKKIKIYQFKCHVCKKYFDNNIKLMKHMHGHIENSRQKNLDLSDLTQCRYCFREFDTPYSMQCHIVAVHLQPNSLACRICNQSFLEMSLLVRHMKMTHCQTEMPYSCSVCQYRSSFHSDVIEHFQQYHNGSEDVLCHYCLKIYQIKFSNSGIGFTQVFYYHLYKHQCKSTTRKCSSCCLTFLNVNDLKTHRMTDHQSMAGAKGITPIKSTNAESVTVVASDKKSFSGESTKLMQALNQRKGLNSECSIINEYLTSVILSKDTIGCRCKECKDVIDANHFRKFVNCGNCHYSTNCSKSFLDHSCHLSGFSPSLLKKVLKLKKPMFCVCGFFHSHGDILALHLIQCKKSSCYSSRQAALAATIKTEPETEYLECQSAFFPPLVVLDEDEEESINESFAKLSAVNVISEEEERILPTEEPIEHMEEEEMEDETHERPDMLNALGLVRKKSSSLPPSTPVSNDDSNEDVILPSNDLIQEQNSKIETNSDQQIDDSPSKLKSDSDCIEEKIITKSKRLSKNSMKS